MSLVLSFRCQRAKLRLDQPVFSATGKAARHLAWPGNANLSGHVTSARTAAFEKSLLKNNDSLDGPPKGWSFSTFSLKDVNKSQLKTEKYELKRRRLDSREFCVPLAFRDLDPYYERIVKDADQFMDLMVWR